jgi:hypothetical protein
VENTGCHVSVGSKGELGWRPHKVGFTSGNGPRDDGNDVRFERFLDDSEALLAAGLSRRVTT